MIFWTAVFLFAALLVYNVVIYVTTPGTVVQKLSAAWQNSSTIFVLIWGGFMTVLTNGMNYLTQLTDDPKFAQVGDYIKGMLPQNAVPLFGLIMLLLPIIGGIIARQRTVGK